MGRTPHRTEPDSSSPSQRASKRAKPECRNKLVGGAYGNGTLSGEGINMTMGTILLVLLILMLVGAFPTWPHSKGWGYYPSGGLGLIVVILIILLLAGRI